jgi:tRNA(Ile2) C34 agmatinyltransferase TiaS
MMCCVDQPKCEGCGLQMKALGRLPPVNGRPGVQVFKCASCRRIASREQARLPKATLAQLNRTDATPAPTVIAPKNN